jgi:LL-diaminopimelate aminotransferase
MIAAKRLESINEYYFSQKLREIEAMNQEGEPVINLGIGSPDLPPHADVINLLRDGSVAHNVHAYQSYKGSKVLRSAMAAWYLRWYTVPLDPETEILPLIGSKEGIMHLCMTYLDEGDEVLVPNPGYPTYRSAVTLAGGLIRDYHLTEENNWMPDLEELEKGGLEKVKMMWVNYPHMPTGQLPTKELFEQLVAFAKKHDILICHDNPYSFILNDRPMSILSVEGAKDVAVELNSLSKSHNMAGWRVGMLCGSKEKIDDVLRFKSNMDSGMFLPVQLAAARALELGQEWHDSLNEVYARRREKAFKLLDHLKCRYSREQAGMFVWAKIPDGYADGFALSDEILHGSRVFITPGGIFGPAGNGYVRVSLCSPEEKLSEALNRIKNTK